MSSSSTRDVVDFTLHSSTKANIVSMDEHRFEGEQSLASDNVYVSLTYNPLDTAAAMSRVKSPKAGAVVLFAGPPALLPPRAPPHH